MLRVLTWNIHGGRDASIGDLASQIASTRADVVCLNEVRRGHGLRLARRLGLHALVASSLFGPYGNVVLTSREIVARHRFHFPDTRRVDRRDAAIVTLAGDLTVAAVHLNLRAPKRQRDILRLLDALPDRAIVAGDMNEGPNGEVWRALAGRFDDAGSRDAAPTFPAKEPRVRIDYVWVPRGSTIHTCEVLETRASDHRAVLVDVELAPATPAPPT